MTTDSAAIHVKSNSEDSYFRIPYGYERWMKRLTLAMKEVS